MPKPGETIHTKETFSAGGGKVLRRAAAVGGTFSDDRAKALRQTGEASVRAVP